MAFEADLAGMLVGVEEVSRGEDTFRSLVIASGVDTLRLYANRDSEEAFNAVKALPPGTFLTIRVALRSTPEGVKLRLLDVRVDKGAGPKPAAVVAS